MHLFITTKLQEKQAMTEAESELAGILLIYLYIWKNM